MSAETEIKYLLETLSAVKYNRNRFTLFCGDNKFIFGVFSAKGEDFPIAKSLQYKTIYDTLIDINQKIHYSFKKAIEYSYSDALQNNFNIISNEISEEEMLAFYYLENAMFRTSSSWDMLAQLYRLYFDINISADKVYYKKIFNPQERFCKGFEDKARIIHAYIEESDDTECDGMWKGNHSFVNGMRNKMTHRNSPNVSVASDFDMNLKSHPCIVLKRTIEDYAVSFKYISEILNDIEAKCQEEITKTLL
jgi:hypothetical protein|uniref:hypothetical protein n=1 Tax=Pseudoruminococcus massiliensis TaxID=2086583 RepID=UPI003FEF615C